MFDLDAFVDEILDIALEQRRDDAAIIIRDRIEKDVLRPLRSNSKGIPSNTEPDNPGE